MAEWTAQLFFAYGKGECYFTPFSPFPFSFLSDLPTKDRIGDTKKHILGYKARNQIRGYNQKDLGIKELRTIIMIIMKKIALEYGIPRSRLGDTRNPTRKVVQ